ncbi:30S ribosomal protein S14 [Bifidobacterium vansinderenii]|uniref:30S ribosomal protein S14 n=2 Tax=Bifidobacterium vansinderenii TaxID=1984871 RepID=A0A229VXN2_9BIFI|nr:30S ribosomal protein S14 [Bifidobacterium vansinderenii]
MKPRTRHKAAMLIAAMLLLSGCGTTSNGGASDNGGMLTWQQANEEYKATVEDFPFALMNDDKFPANMPKAQSSSSLYAKGSGEGQAYFYWQCSVERNILDNSRTAPETARESLKQLRKLLDTDWFKNYYEDKDGIVENDVIGKSELGDYSTMRDFYNTDCTWYRQENGLAQ